VLASACILLVATRAVTAQQLTREPTIDWSMTPVTAGVTLPGQGPDGATALRLQATAPGPTSFHLVTIDHPAVAGPAYVVAGQIRYQDVEGQGYLELWTVFPDGQRFFSRTLGTQGPLAALHGESNWRRFELPFDLSGASQVPSRLEINLVLPGRGAVWLGPIHLQQTPAPAGKVQGVWWSERAGTLVGTILGGFLGVFGAIIGVLGGRGRARRLVLTLLGASWGGGGVKLPATARLVPAPGVRRGLRRDRARDSARHAAPVRGGRAAPDRGLGCRRPFLA